MSESTPPQPAPRSAPGPARRWVVSALLVASLATAALLLWNGSASGAAASSARSVPVSSEHLLGLPLGAAVWLLLGVAGLLVGLTGVGRSRGARRNSSAAAGPAQFSDEPAVVAA